MSIALGFYDVFSYAVPGMFYLYLINEVLRIAGWKYVNIIQLAQSGDAAPNALIILLLGILAFVTGHVFEAIRSVLLDRILYFGSRDRALENLKKRLAISDIKVDFHFDEWTIYQEVLRIRNPEAVIEQERLKSIAFMLRNLSFGASMLAVLQGVEFFSSSQQTYHLVVCGLAILASYFLYNRSRRFDEWFFRTVYTQVLVYGGNIKDIIQNSTPAWKEDVRLEKIREKTKNIPQKHSGNLHKSA
ncbi:hypothetical protein ANAEL_04340 [Anaerolineales bacterium]|nr:hypothetical protein ANAEL_04340 [Anaerolineales bacterium]